MSLRALNRLVVSGFDKNMDGRSLLLPVVLVIGLGAGALIGWFCGIAEGLRMADRARARENMERED